MIYDTYILDIFMGILDYIIYMEYKRYAGRQREYNSINYISAVAVIITDIICNCTFLYYNRSGMYIILAPVMLLTRDKTVELYRNITDIAYYIGMMISTNIVVRFFLETYSFTRIEKHYSDIKSEIMCIIMIKIIFIILVNVYKKYIGVEFGKIGGTAITFTSLSVTMLIVLVSRIGYEYIQIRHSITVILVILWLFMNIIVIFINAIERSNRYSYELIMLERERETNRKIYDNIKAGQEELRNIRHDMKNRLNTLRAVVSQNDSDTVLEYLDSMIGSVDSVKGRIYCNNLLINNILTYKLDGLDADIELKCEAEVSEQLDIDMGDMGVIIGNLLDNSIRGAKAVEKGGYVHIIITQSIGRLIIVIENNYIKNKVKKPISYYIDHGRGINNVRRLVNKYEGTYSEKITDNVYRTEITIEI